MNRFRRLISIALVATFVLTLSMVGFALGDDPLMLKKQDDSQPLLGLSSTDTIVHNQKFLTGYDILNVIDVSYANGNINWSEVKADGIDYAIIRAGYRGYSSGDILPDSQFSANINGAISAGINVGVYFYSQAISVREATDEANYVLNLINGYDIKLPVAFDFEFASDGGRNVGRLYKAFLDKGTMTDICNAFCSRISSCGYDAMVYANQAMLNDHLYAGSIAVNYPVWLAHYTDETTYTGEYSMWQFTSKGSVNGISGNVDRSFWYKSQSKADKYLRITVSSPEIGAYETRKINAFFNSSALSSPDAEFSPIEWISSNEDTATVDEDGIVTPQAYGKVTITAKYSVIYPADPDDSESVEQTVEYSESLNFSCAGKPTEPEEPIEPYNPNENDEPVPGNIDNTPVTGGSDDLSSILRDILDFFVSIFKLIISLFTEIDY